MRKKSNDQDGILIEKHSVKELFDKLDEIIDHAKYTNGKIADALERIDRIEKRSFGVWVAEHPIKSIVLAVLFTAVVISDFRHPIINFIMEMI